MKCANEKCNNNPMSSGGIIEVISGVFACDQVCADAYNAQQLYYWENKIFGVEVSTELPLDFNTKDVDKP